MIVHVDMSNQITDNLITFSFGYLISPTGVDSYFNEFTVCKVCRRILRLVGVVSGEGGRVDQDSSCICFIQSSSR